jgi:D-inositol-3-phosphate glycosyltransferase
MRVKGSVDASLAFRRIPGSADDIKDADVNQTEIMGAAVASSGLARALLRYGSYDRYYFLWEPSISLEEARARLAQYPNGERAHLVRLEERSRLRHIKHMILLTGTPVMQPLAHFRTGQGRSTWPVVGITHSLSYSINVWLALMTLCESWHRHDCLICTSHAGRQALENILNGLSEAVRRRIGGRVAYTGQLPVIPLGIDTEYFCPVDRAEARLRLGIDQDQVVFLYLGRFSAADKMDPYPLILAFAQSIYRQHRHACLILAGNDTQFRMASRIEQFVRDLGVADRVRVMPNLRAEDKRSLYAAADVFLSLSDSVQETFGLTVVEAMACGLPVIASDWDGYRESVQPGVTGLLVPTYWANCVKEISGLARSRGDPETHWLLGQSVCVDMKALTESMLALAEDPELRRRMGEAGRQRARQEYSWPVIVGRYEQLWEELLRRAAADGENASDGAGFGCYDHVEVFGHYATEVIGPDVVLRSTSAGQQFAAGQLRLQALEHGPAEGTGLARTILAHVTAGDAVSIADVIDRVARHLQFPSETVFHQIARLWKYGLLEPCRTP